MNPDGPDAIDPSRPPWQYCADLESARSQLRTAAPDERLDRFETIAREHVRWITLRDMSQAAVFDDLIKAAIDVGIIEEDARNILQSAFTRSENERRRLGSRPSRRKSHDNVFRVVDGDTIDVDIDLGFYVWIKKQRIRLLGIDAPETRGESRPEGLAATEYLKSLIDGQAIILRTVKGSDGGDRDDSFGRWLGTIYHGDMDVNAEMIRAGHAIPYEDR